MAVLHLEVVDDEADQHHREQDNRIPGGESDKDGDGDGDGNGDGTCDGDGCVMVMVTVMVVAISDTRRCLRKSVE
jgi:hypothetical protein